MKTVISTGHGRLHLVESAKAVASVGVDVTLVCGWVPRRADGFFARLCSKIVGRNISAGLKKRVISIPNVKVCPVPSVEFLEQGTRMLLGRFLRGFGIDTVQTFMWALFGFATRRFLGGAEIFHVRSGAGQGGAIRAAKHRGMKVVVDHSIAHPRFLAENVKGFSKDSKFWAQVLKDCEDGDVVMVNSFFVRDTFVERGFDSSKLRVVYLGEREDFFGLRQRRLNESAEVGRQRLRLLFTGGFGYRKGAEYILEALKILKERGVEFEMDCVGSYAGIEALIARYEKDIAIIYCNKSSVGCCDSNHSHKINFYGPKPQDELKLFLARGDIYVFPSLAEGCAQSGMEAMSAGLCVIGTRESGFPITDGKDGYIVPSKDAMAIANRIEWLSKNRDVIDHVGNNAAKLIRENFTWAKYGENVKKLYEELMRS